MAFSLFEEGTETWKGQIERESEREWWHGDDNYHGALGNWVSYSAMPLIQAPPLGMCTLFS